MQSNTHLQQPHTGGNPALKYIGGALLIAILFVAGLMPKLRNQNEIATAAKTSSDSAPEVQITHARLATPDALILPGDVQAILETTVQARTSGYISKLYVDIGSHVKAGQVLADIVSPDVDQQAAQAYADTAKSRATVSQSEADVVRQRAGVAQTQADSSRQKAAISQAQAAFESAKSRVSAAQAGLAQARARLAQSQQGIKVQQANLAQAQAQYDLADSNLKRYSTLLKQGFVSQEDFDTAAATFKTASATVDSVRANIEAARADVRAAEQTVESNQASVASARSDQDAAYANVTAAKAAYNSTLATVDAAKSNVVASKAEVQANVEAVGSSVANARRYEALRSYLHVVAPFTGVITSRNVDVGSLVSPGTTAATSNNAAPTTGMFGIAGTDTLRIFINLPQSYFQWVKPGTQVNVSIREFPKQIFAGRVFNVAGALDSSTRTLLTEVRLPNSNHRLLPGMYAQVQISPGNATALRVPAAALIVDASGTRVAVVDSSDRLHFRKVQLGRDYGTEVEVLQGLSPEDQLVGNPSDNLVDGGTVKVVTGSGK